MGAVKLRRRSSDTTTKISKFKREIFFARTEKIGNFIFFYDKKNRHIATLDHINQKLFTD